MVMGGWEGDWRGQRMCNEGQEGDWMGNVWGYGVWGGGVYGVYGCMRGMGGLWFMGAWARYGGL